MKAPGQYFSRSLKYMFPVLIILFLGTNIKAQNRIISFSDSLSSIREVEYPQRLFADTENGLNLQYHFQGAEVAVVDMDTVVFHYLHVPGFTKMAQVGAPALPVHNELIALPPGAEADIQIINMQYIEYSDYKIHPALKPARDTEGYPEPAFEIDQELYSTDAFFPEKVVRIKDIYKTRDIPLALIEIVPVQFNPVSGLIRVYSEIELKILFKGSSSFTEIADANSRHFTNLLKRNVLNSDDIPEGINTNENNIDRGGAKNYIIITHDNYITQAEQLAEWKRQLGYSVEVVSASSWTAAEIKNAIHNRYHSWIPRPDYFLIIGDHDGAYAVPGEVHYHYGEAFTTDLYFACMDGQGDWHPDMAHGRISVSDATEAQTVIDKIINYEQMPPDTAGFYQNALNCAMYQDDDNNGYADRRFCHTSEEIRDYLQDEQSYTSERVYNTTTSADITSLRYNNGYYSNGQLLPAELRSPSFNWNGGETDITAAIDAGKFLVFHRDHGYVGGSGWAHPYYTTISMEALSNGVLLPVVFSINCHTGEFQLSNCFAEKFIRMPGKGAVGVFAASYLSYSGSNDALSIGMVDAIWSDPGLYPVFGTAGTGNNYTIGPGNDIYTMGDVLNQGLYAMEQNVASSVLNQYTYEIFHWFGDPAMRMWTENPNNNPITAIHSTEIDCAANTFAISGSTPGALASLVYNNSIIGKTILDSTGNGIIGYHISTPGAQAKLCISKANHKAYLCNLAVTGSCLFPPLVNSLLPDAITDSSANVSGEILNDFGYTVIESGIVYGTDPNPVIGGNNVTKIETSPPVTTGSFTINISGLCCTSTYYYQAYAINANGTSYGGNLSFTTTASCESKPLPYTESFNQQSFPVCWTQQSSGGATDRWSISNTYYSGGQAYEMMAIYEDVNPAISRLVTPSFNTIGLTEIELRFKHFFDDFGPGVTIKIQSSVDSINWTDESWYLNSGGGNTGPEEVETQIVHNLNSLTTYLAFTIEGDLYQFDFWYIDDVEVNLLNYTGQYLILDQGWNMASFYVSPVDKDIENIFQPLINGNQLIKVMDEAGNFLQDIPGTGWLNTIGDMANTEGYYVKVNAISFLDIYGLNLSLGYPIPLYAGWNIMGHPSQDSTNALDQLQPLIDSSYLIKVLNEEGGFIQNIPGLGWVNTIGDFVPGEGYYIKVADSCSLVTPFSEWMHYDNGTNHISVGYNAAGSLSAAIRFEPADLAPYAGGYLSQVKFFPSEQQADYYIRVWSDTNAANLLLDQYVPSPVIDTWNTISLDTLLPIDINKELWFGYYVDAQTGYPAGADAGPAVAGYGDLIYTNNWYSLSNNLGMDYNWNIQGLVTNATEDDTILLRKSQTKELPALPTFSNSNKFNKTGHSSRNPFQPMNILMIPAHIGGITSCEGDLVLAFDDTLCVGTAVVKDVNQVLNLVASASDIEGAGFRNGNAIRLEYHSLPDQAVYELKPANIFMGSMEYQPLETFYAVFEAMFVNTSETLSRQPIQVYPNPVSSMLHILNNEANSTFAGKMQVDILSISGRKLFSGKYPSTQYIINLDMEVFPPGEYVLLINTGSRKISKKLIKK